MPPNKPDTASQWRRFQKVILKQCFFAVNANNISTKCIRQEVRLSPAPTDSLFNFRKKKKKTPWSRRVRAAELRPSGSLSISQIQQGTSLYSSNTNLFHHFGGGCRGAKLAGITDRSGENKDRKENPLLFVSQRIDTSVFLTVECLISGEDDEQGGASMKQPYIVGALLVLYRCPNPMYDGVKAMKYLKISAFFSYKL